MLPDNLIVTGDHFIGINHQTDEEKERMLLNIKIYDNMFTIPDYIKSIYSSNSHIILCTVLTC